MAKLKGYILLKRWSELELYYRKIDIKFNQNYLN